MTSPLDIEALETSAYRSRFDDGLVDIFLGLSLVWIGVSWIWLEDLAAFAGFIPAIVSGPFVVFRSRFLDERAGHVRFSRTRRSRERRSMAGFLIAGVAVGVVAVGGYVLAVDDAGVLADRASYGLIAGIVGCIALGLAVVTRLARFAVYGAVLFAGAVWAAAMQLNPGAPLLPGGAVALAWGGVLLARFVRAHPVGVEEDR